MTPAPVYDDAENVQ